MKEEQKESYKKDVEKIIHAILDMAPSEFHINNGYLFYNSSHGLGYPNNNVLHEQNKLEYYHEPKRLIAFINEVVLPTMYMRSNFYKALRPRILKMVVIYDVPLAQLLETRI